MAKRGKKKLVDTKSNNPSKVVHYPSAEMLMNICMEDYQRIQDNYSKIYEKVNIALVFAGAVLTIVLNTFNTPTFSLPTVGKKSYELVLSIIEGVTFFGSIVLILIAIIWLLCLLLGRKVRSFKSEDIIDKSIHLEENEYAATWVMDKYTTIVGEIRPIIEKKQNEFNSAMRLLIFGIILYAVFMILQKGGF